MMKLGLRVVRGPDWNHGSKDDGEGHVGTVVHITTGSVKTVDVIWDSGYRYNYRVGYQDAFDLRIIDSAPARVTHQNIRCDSCGEKDMAGIRWQCRQCANFDLCSPCYMSDKHDLTHTFLRYMTKSSTGVKIPRRLNAVKIQMKGIFPSAVVIRGPDWKWGNQDGMGDDKTGRVENVIRFDSTLRSGVHVRWSSGAKNSYRRGLDGKLDLQYIEGEDAVGDSYYRDHLPILGDETRPLKETESCENVTSKKVENIKSLSLLSENFLTLFLNDKYSDFTVNVAGREFRVHKAVLGARSSVFDSMLQHDMKEKNTGSVELTDCDPDTFEDFIFYLYSAKTERISLENVTGLYELAEKYDVQGLKGACLHIMKENLSVDSLCDGLALALRYDEQELIELATNYFISNTEEILLTVQWQVFLKENPVAANELYLKSFCKAKTKN